MTYRDSPILDEAGSEAAAFELLTEIELLQTDRQQSKLFACLITLLIVSVTAASVTYMELGSRHATPRPAVLSPKNDQPAASAEEPLTPQEETAILEGFLPKSARLFNVGGSDQIVQVVATAQYDDSRGVAAIGISVGTDPSDGSGSQTPADQCAAESGLTCVAQPNGAVVGSLQTHEYPDWYIGGPNAIEWTASAWRSDGVQIQISEWNAPAAKGAEISMKTPPIPINELTSIVLSPKWQLEIDPAQLAR